MTCEEFNFSVNLVFDHLGDAELSNDIQNHMKMCNACAQEYNRLKNYFDKLNSNPKGIEVSERFIQGTIDVILQNKILPLRETSSIPSIPETPAVPTEITLKPHETMVEKKPEAKKEVEKIEIEEQTVVKQVEIKTSASENTAPKRRHKKTVVEESEEPVTKDEQPVEIKAKKSFDLYFFYAIIGASCLIIAYIILQFFIH
jgi:hypothetical protein